MMLAKDCIDRRKARRFKKLLMKMGIVDAQTLQ
jgi:hypothetical protein